MSTPPRLIAFALAASLASQGAHRVAATPQVEPDVSGRWLQAPPLVDALPRALDVTRTDLSIAPRSGPRYPATRLTVVRDGGRGTSPDEFQVGTVGGTTGGLTTSGGRVNAATSFSNHWDGNVLVMERRASRGQPPGDEWNESTERWRLVASALHVTRTERGSTAPERRWEARYRREQAPAADRLAPVRALLGEWEGTAEGEGLVNEHRLDAAASTPTRLVFESVRFDNLDPAWRARETYDLQGPDAFTETFELAESGKALAVYSRSRFARRP